MTLRSIGFGQDPPSLRTSIQPFNDIYYNYFYRKQQYIGLNYLIIIENNVKSHLGYFSIFAGLGLVYLFKNHMDKRGQHKLRLLSKEITIKIAQQIKYQMLTVCWQFARKVSKSLKKALNPTEMDKVSNRMKDNMESFYQQKQMLILEKYQAQKQAYEQSLLSYRNDTQLQRIKSETELIMKRAINGDIPDLAVPQQASKHLTCEMTLKVYREMQEYIIILVWKEVMSFMNKDPFFHPKNQKHFKQVLKKLSLYDLKVEFLVEKGYLREWGCPSEIFLKIILGFKQNEDLNTRIGQIQLIYDNLIDVIQDNPSNTNEEQIKLAFGKIND